MTTLKYLFMLKILYVLFIFLSSCTSGQYSKFSLRKITFGNFKLGKAKNQQVFHVFRAIGQPLERLELKERRYYKWKHDRSVGISYPLLGGVNGTLYCFFTVETTKTDRIQYITWYGNDCLIYLDNFKSYFKNNLKMDIEVNEEVNKELKDDTKNTENEVKK